MNPRILLSVFMILGVFGLVGAGVYAFFSDTGTSSGNVFATGSFNLKLSDDNETSQDNVSATWVGTTMVPGGASISGTLNLKNTGTIAGNNIHFKAANTNIDAGDPQDDGTMAKHLRILALDYDGVDKLPLITDTNANGHADLQDLESGGAGVELGLLTDLNVDHPLFMSVQLDSATDNSYQGDSVSTIFTATLHQDASQ